MAWWQIRKAEAARREDTLRPHPVYLAMVSDAESQNRVHCGLGLGLSSLRFSQAGELLPGIYRLSFSEFKERFGGSRRRKILLVGLEEVVTILAACGCRRLYVGGSMVTEKSNPSDFDAVFDVVGMDLGKLENMDAAMLLRSRADLEALKSRFLGSVEPLRHLPSLGCSMLEVLQYDSRSGRQKGVVEIVLNS
ncbi:MAG: hypothetical protein R3D26_04585 [Cyanobacteriota/Melainabacteria group bacterium]